MANDAFRPRKISAEDTTQGQQEEAPAMDFEGLATIQQGAGVEMGTDVTPDATGAPEFKGNLPPALKKMMAKAEGVEEKPRGPVARAKPQNPTAPQQGRDVIQNFIDVITPFTDNYEEITLPSLGKFYNGQDGPTDGKINIRPMTGQEEKILATPHIVKKGRAVNMIFKNCMLEKFDPDELLSIDRTYLLIYLRAISYQPEYEVQIKCTDCATPFNTTIDLTTLYLNMCDDDFDSNSLTDTMPKTGFRFTYRLSKGKDETAIAEHRDRRIKNWGDNAADDTLLFRASLLVESIENDNGQVLTGQHNIMGILEKLPIQDVAYIRNLVSEPPFGVDTRLSLFCPSCTQEFQADLPLEANFFFPRTRRKATAQV